MKYGRRNRSADRFASSNNHTNMANMCCNWFYCSTDNDRNMEKIIYFLDEEFGFTELDGERNRVHGRGRVRKVDGGIGGRSLPLYRGRFL